MSLNEESEDEFDKEVEAMKRIDEERNPNKRKSEKINNIDGVETCLEEIKAQLPWLETLRISQGIDQTVSADDDLNRELAFYKATIAGVTKGRSILEEMKVPYLRPKDYFAEMVKTDAHMDHIKQALEFEQHKMDIVEQRKIDQMQRKFAKKARQTKQEKKKQTNYMKEYKGNSKGLEEALNKEESDSKRGKGEFNMGKKNNGSNPMPNKRRQMKNKKYGGTKKRGSKWQTKEGANNISSKEFRHAQKKPRFHK